MEIARAIRRGVVACHTCEMVALAIWIGGLVVIIGSVIPAVFNSFGMEPGGRFLTRVFDGYNRLVMVAIVLLVTAGAFRLWAAARYRLAEVALTRPEVLLLSLMIAIALLIMMVMRPTTVKLQDEAFAIKEEVARKAAYAAFFRTHMVVRGLYLVNLILGIVLVAVKLRSVLRPYTVTS
jgi:Domain of unknown function (DUF4149)